MKGMDSVVFLLAFLAVAVVSLLPFGAVFLLAVLIVEEMRMRMMKRSRRMRRMQQHRRRMMTMTQWRDQ